MKETAVCRQEKANCISSDILADMLNGTEEVCLGTDTEVQICAAHTESE